MKKANNKKPIGLSVLQKQRDTTLHLVLIIYKWNKKKKNKQAQFYFSETDKIFYKFSPKRFDLK